MPQRPYDAIRYPTYPRIETHPDRLAAVGDAIRDEPRAGDALPRAGNRAAATAAISFRWRIFCPESRFFGRRSRRRRDRRRAIARIADLKLRNIELRERDLRDLDRDAGEFDYIVAHGCIRGFRPTFATA